MLGKITHLTVRNGLTLAYVVALVNALLALLLAFGVNITTEQSAAITAFVNAAMLLAARVLHLPESTPDGGTVRVTHVPVLQTQGPVQTTHGPGGETTVTPLPTDGATT
jgi:hypothetical protein